MKEERREGEREREREKQRKKIKEFKDTYNKLLFLSLSFFFAIGLLYQFLSDIFYLIFNCINNQLKVDCTIYSLILSN